MENCSCSTCVPPAFSIFTGDDATMNLQLKTSSESGVNPVDLTSCTEIDVALPNQDGTFSHLLFTLGQVVIVPSALLGNFSATITEEVSALLQVGVLLNFNVTFTIGGLKTTVQYFQALSVFQSN